MTREEAIEYAESKKMRLEALVYNDDCKYGNYAMYSGELSFVNAALTALRPVSRERVEMVWRGEWIKLSAYRGMEQYKCSKCGQEIYVPEFMGEPIYSFCPMCSSAMMDSSVDLIIDKLGEMKFE